MFENQIRAHVVHFNSEMTPDLLVICKHIMLLDMLVSFVINEIISCVAHWSCFITFGIDVTEELRSTSQKNASFRLCFKVT